MVKLSLVVKPGSGLLTVSDVVPQGRLGVADNDKGHLKLARLSNHIENPGVGPRCQLVLIKSKLKYVVV